jgi:hypothetical protein
MTIVYPAILGTFLVALLSRTRGSDSSATAGLAVGIASGATFFFGLSDVIAWPWAMLVSTSVTVLVGCLGARRKAPGPIDRPAV